MALSPRKRFPHFWGMREVACASVFQASSQFQAVTSAPSIAMRLQAGRTPKSSQTLSGRTSFTFSGVTCQNTRPRGCLRTATSCSLPPSARKTSARDGPPPASRPCGPPSTDTSPRSVRGGSTPAASSPRSASGGSRLAGSSPRSASGGSILADSSSRRSGSTGSTLIDFTCATGSTLSSSSSTLQHRVPIGTEPPSRSSSTQAA
mmetsp:Transcript_60854/g.191321  ORF Transcript_60854/g.191321 Transcript_60854/m.191321 type:complete len:205 (+) Transcript_60854:133-747(+)